MQLSQKGEVEGHNSLKHSRQEAERGRAQVGYSPSDPLLPTIPPPISHHPLIKPSYCEASKELVHLLNQIQTVQRGENHNGNKLQRYLLLHSQVSLCLWGFLKILKLWINTLLVPVLKKQRQQHIYEFETSLVTSQDIQTSQDDI